jgi:hypothetical protein
MWDMGFAIWDVQFGMCHGRWVTGEGWNQPKTWNKKPETWNLEPGTKKVTIKFNLLPTPI